MFHELPDEQHLYHSLATVGTLLLQIGEVGKKFPSTTLSPEPPTPVEEVTEQMSQVSVEEPSTPRDSKVDTEWSISFEQFLASMLTEPPLVKYFEERVDLALAIEKFRNRRLYTRSESNSASPPESL
jgi:hypothetical protein